MRDVDTRMSVSSVASPRPTVFLSLLILAVAGLSLPVGGCKEEVQKPADELLAEGWKFFQAADYEHAMPALEGAVKGSTADPVLHQKALYALATAWNLRRPDFKRDLAAKLYQEAADMAPDSDTAAWSLLALARMKHVVPPGEDADLDALKKLHSDFEPIRKAYQQVIDRFPEHPAGHEAFLYQQSTFVASLDAGEARQAVAAIGAFLAKHPKARFESALYTLMGQAHFTLGQYQDHLACEIKALESRPMDPTNPKDDYAQPYYQIACAAEFEVGDFATARKYYQKLIDEYPVDVRGAAAHTALKRMDQIEADARRGVLPPLPAGLQETPAAETPAPKGAGS
jgi:tetratricopeptide (TPR) repeat protein